jgi:DNA invertase Pin-like site-specific DNA recombinase
VTSVHPPDSDQPITVALLYTRVSSGDQAKEGVSLDDQENATRAYVATKPGWIIGGEFQDVLSGTRDDRADYQRMLNQLRLLKAEKRRPAVVVKFQDRLGRDMPEASRAYGELQKLDVDVHVVAAGGVTSELEYYMRALIAQEESRNIGRRIRSTFAYFRARGWHKPGAPPWGYALRPATADERADGAPKSVLELDETTAPYVRDAWEQHAAGASVRAIAIWASGLPVVARGDRNLGYNAIRKLFRAPVYVGRLGEYEDDDPDAVLALPPARTPALIDDDVWRRVTVLKRLGEKMPRQASGDYPLTGLIRCSRCGSRMSGRLKGTQGGSRVARREYICHAGLVLGAGNAERRCLMTVKAEAIEAPVLRALVEMLDVAGQPANRKRIMRELTRQQQSGAAVQTAERQLADLDDARRKLIDRLHALTTMRADGELDAETYATSSRRYREEVERIDGELKRLRGTVRRPAAEPFDALLMSCPAWARAIASADGRELREALAIFLESVSPVKVARGAYEPDWTFTETGLGVLRAAIAGLSERRTAREREAYAHLVSVDHLARAKWSTLPIPHPRSA